MNIKIRQSQECVKKKKSRNKGCHLADDETIMMRYSIMVRTSYVSSVPGTYTGTVRSTVMVNKNMLYVKLKSE